MKNKLFSLLIVAIFIIFIIPAFGAENNLDPWFENLKTRIQKLAPKRQQINTTVAGGVRGEKESSETIYWKGKEDLISEDEFQDFNAALEKVLHEDYKVAKEEFKRFVAKYPSSILIQDAKEALERLK